MQIFRSMIIEAPIEKVWAAVRAFDGVAAWNPGVTNARLESGAATATGTIRSLQIADGTVFRETLLAHSDVETFYTYDILESPLPVTGYVSTHRFFPITHSDQTLGVWESRFECTPEDAAQMERVVGDVIYIGGMTGLNMFLKES
ncbi:SRPBCC family protein [Pelagibius sp. Alg239-R121]|uniref:SRPBCC family protein n=1 Tax=Pelagibius sp. Alg239-R121 TaxID=2993448 RepID=UPI0024A6527B|nr:SRPBCC family protein [Pelagibius sp. Alg239-R121]